MVQKGQIVAICMVQKAQIAAIFLANNLRYIYQDATGTTTNVVTGSNTSSMGHKQQYHTFTTDNRSPNTTGTWTKRDKHTEQASHWGR